MKYLLIIMFGFVFHACACTEMNESMQSLEDPILGGNAFLCKDKNLSVEIVNNSKEIICIQRDIVAISVSLGIHIDYGRNEDAPYIDIAPNESLTLSVGIRKEEEQFIAEAKYILVAVPYRNSRSSKVSYLVAKCSMASSKKQRLKI